MLILKDDPRNVYADLHALIRPATQAIRLSASDTINAIFYFNTSNISVVFVDLSYDVFI